MKNDEQADAIDELFQVPLNEFTAKRNALVKALRGADATRVRTLSKPSIVAWAVNQVYWRARPVYESMIKTGQRLRKSQLAALEGRSADIRGATEAHRRAVADAVAEAERLATAAGSRPGRDALMRTFEALSLSAEPPEHPGRLSEALQPAGFEALTGVTPKAMAAPQPRSDRVRRAESEPASPRDERAERARRRQEAEEARRQAAEAKKHQAEIKTRQAAVERAKASEARARAEWERAQQAVRDAEQHLAAVKRLRS